VQGLVRDIWMRFLPGLLIATGVTLLTAGMFTYAGPVEQGPVRAEAPTVVSLATPIPVATIPPLDGPGPSFVPATPLPPPLPAGWPTAPSGRVATRIIIVDLRIDLAVIKGNEDYPACGVALYFPTLGQPGGGRAVYIYGHARTGMFLPILDASKVRNGQRMLGMIVDVFTSDNFVFRYRIEEVRRHQVGGLANAWAATSEELWLQTSEGPRGTPGKTQVIARPYSVSETSQSEAHPRPRPYVCG
jgi:hypothetical protein